MPDADRPGSAWTKCLDHLEEGASALLLAVMALLAIANVALRYLTNYSFAFTEELEVSLLVFLTLFGAAAAFRRGLHLGLDAVRSRLPARWQRWLLLFSCLLTSAVFVVLIYFSLLQMRDERELNTLSEALELPQWIYTLAIPLGSVCIILRVLQRTRTVWKELGASADRLR